jgi:hypothetical protein
MGDSQMGIGPPTGKTGNAWSEDDFADSQAELALRGGPEFVEFCKSKGSCELSGETVGALQAILSKYPSTDSGDIDYFAVVVRERLIDAGLLPAGDPNRYQYSVAQLATVLGG